MLETENVGNLIAVSDCWVLLTVINDRVLSYSIMLLSNCDWIPICCWV